jgi:putative PIN family toxin of toxin-antitoxin system
MTRRGSTGLPVVIDTNVVLSALVFGGDVPGRLRHAWQSGACQALASPATAQELIRTLAYPKFRLSADEQHELLADYLPYATIVHVPQPPPTVPACRDPFDLPFLHLAAAGKATTLITGDKDLLALAGRCRFAIITPSIFLDGL